MTTDPGSGPPVTPPPSEPGEADVSARLQAMLAQASQGQRDEQREISTALADVRNQLVRLGQEVAELRAAPAPDVAEGAINNMTVELREAVRFLSDRLDGVTRMVAQRGEELADIRTALSTNDAHVRSQAETIGVLSTGLQALPSYGERVSALHEQINAVHERLGGVERALARPADAGVNNRLAAIEASVAPLREHLAGADKAATDHEANLARTASALRAIEEKVDALAAGTQAALATPAGFDDTAITAVDQRLADVAADLTSLREQVAGLVARDQGAAESASRTDVEDAIRVAEERLRSHVDDAVLALANALLRPRSASSPDPVGGSAPVEVPGLADQSGWAPVAAHADFDDDNEDDDEQVLGEAPAIQTRAQGTPALAVEMPEWWTRGTAESTSSDDDEDDDEDDEEDDEEVPSISELNAPAIPSLDEDVATAEAGAVDFSAVQLDDEDGLPTAPPAQAGGPVPTGAGSFDPSLADTSSWAPEVPRERTDVPTVPPPDPAPSDTAPTDPADATVVPERKRGFFKRK